MHWLWCHKYDICISFKAKFLKKQNNELLQRKLQLILCYLYIKTIKRRGEILLHRHFKWNNPPTTTQATIARTRRCRKNILTSFDSITAIIVSKFVRIPIAVTALSSDSSESSRFLNVMAWRNWKRIHLNSYMQFVVIAERKYEY